MDGVDDEVREDLLDLARVDHRVEVRRMGEVNERDALVLRRLLEERDRAVDELAEHRVLARGPAAAPELEKMRDDLGHPRALAEDRLRVILEALGRRGGKDHQLRAAHDHVERIAELVRDPGRERADHVQPLGVPELRDGERALALLGGDEVPETIEQHGDEQEDREAPSLVPKHHRGVQSLLVRDDRDEHPGCERGDREGIPDAPTAEPGAERHGEHVEKREADIDARGPVPRRRRHEERGADYDSVLADDSLRLPGSDDRSGSARSQLHLDSVCACDRRDDAGGCFFATARRSVSPAGRRCARGAPGKRVRSGRWPCRA